MKLKDLSRPRRETRRGLISEIILRRSFTLIELIVVMAIIGILGGLTMIALSGAQKDAQIARTRATIRKINDVILAKWEEYASRALPIELPAVALVPTAAANGAVPVSGQEISRMRLVGLRDLMRLEMPDRITDVLYPPTLLNLEVVNSNSRSILQLGNLPYPALWSTYRERFCGYPTAVLPTPYVPPGAGLGSVSSQWTKENESAELLYWVVSTSSSNGIGGLEQFRSTEIDDTDDDGYPEFIDAWGRPIFWLRWPAGAGGWSEIVASAVADAQSTETRGGDAMDVTRADWRYLDDASGNLANNPYTLQPLIISAGPDGAFDIVFDTTDIDPGSARVIYALQRPIFSIPNPFLHGGVATYFYPDPYRSYTVAGNDVMLGQAYDYDPNGSHIDNITSHDTLFDQ